MAKLLKIVALFCLLLISSNFALAENIPVQKSTIQKINNQTADIDLKINGSTFPLSKTELIGWVSEKNELNYNPKYKSEIENQNICLHKKSILCKLTFDIKKENHIKKSTSFFISTDSVDKFLDDLARKTNRDPENAKLIMEGGKVSVFSLSQKGIELDKEKSATILIKYLTGNNSSNSIELPYLEKSPEISTGSIENLGITELIGEGHSNFKGSPKNRVFNIKVATNRFNGALIKPGEEFSFVKILGEVDGEHGYLPELVIKHNKTEAEFGGGICQVSTTAFRAAIYSGLKITMRKNHAYPVSYYNPQGMDSTVYIPKPDLRFVNNTPSHILIQTEIVGTELIFRFYGTSDGRKTTVIGPTITERNPDGSLKASFTQQVFDATGKMSQEDVFNSAYASPSKYPHPGDVLTTKPKDWSSNEWSQYLKANKKP
ncbi:MAG: VanW family protein [Candidatus Moranbacteria bacterium]|nr:VanW family protein [Candidatus Moranbacteria bacterium]